MDNRPIGVFDSGLGGLTAVRELMRLLPRESIVYFGDTGRVPYGTRSRETIIKYTGQDIRFFLPHNVKLLVAACGTVSTVALPSVAGAVAVPVIGVVEPSVRSALAATKNRRIGMIGTAATIASGAYEALMKRLSPGVEIVSRACPLFVPLVEDGRFRRDDPLVQMLVGEYLSPLKAGGVDTIILGCTHYPLLAGAIADFMGPDVRLISSGCAVAEAVALQLSESDGLCGRESGEVAYYVSADVESFRRYASMYMEQAVGGCVERVDIERY